MRRYIILGPIVVAILWFILTSFHVVKPIFLPSPVNVVVTLYKLFVNGTILPDLIKTVYRWIVGLLIGISLGIPLGMLMGYSDKIYNSLEVVVDFFRSIPAMTLFPLFLVFFGLGDKPKVAVSCWAALLYVLINAMYGVKHSRGFRLIVAKSLRATPFQTFTKIIFPDALPEIAGGIRVALSLSLIVTVASEMIMGTKFGLGRRIFDSALIYHMSEMYATIIIAGLLGYLSNKLFVLFENKLIHWAGK